MRSKLFNRQRRYTPVDKWAMRLQQGLKTLLGPHHDAEPTPPDSGPESELDARERRQVAGLMRVDHAGEVAAQALYHGQALGARSEAVRAAMERNADEETNHLAWCRERLIELGGRTSVLDPVWYTGAFAIGALAGLAGDRWSLGFVAETERQVVEHLDKQLRALPETDTRSRAILERMRDDEGRHATAATQAGAAPLPQPVRDAMRLASRVMTHTAYWL